MIAYRVLQDVKYIDECLFGCFINFVLKDYSNIFGMCLFAFYVNLDRKSLPLSLSFTYKTSASSLLA